MENQKEVKKERKKSVVLPIMMIVGSILVAYFMSGVGPAPETYNPSEDILRKIDSLELVNQQLRDENVKLDSSIQEYRLRIDDLDWRLSELVKKRMATRDTFHKRAEVARSEDAQATEQFFKDRYNF